MNRLDKARSSAKRRVVGGRGAASGRVKLKTGKAAPKRKRALPSRGAVILLILSLLLLGIVARAVVLQIGRGAPLKKMAEEQYLKEIEIPARRGQIYDRNGNALAVSNEVESIYAKPNKVADARQGASLLAKKLGMKREELEKKLTSDRYFVWLKRRVDPRVAAEVKGLHLPYVDTVTETRRFYPNRSLFSHILGAVDVDGRGIEGVEAIYETELAGLPGTATGLRDARGRTLVTEDLQSLSGIAGSDVYLTVDREIQSLAAQALQEGVAAVHAKSGSAIVLDPRSGELLAMANYPEFNPNTIDKVPLALRRNRAVTDLFEPGSTFKTILMASALEEGVVRIGDLVFCENGQYHVGGRTIHDVHPMGLISAKKVIASSSNIGAAKIGVQLGRERFGRYIHDFGFGQKSGVELPGEASGIVRPPPKWPLIQLATVSYGQGISVTALQIAQAYAAVANHGVLQPVRLVRHVQTPEGVKHAPPAPNGRRVISPETAHVLNEMLQAVVGEEGGTGGKARVSGVATAGKTATAQKPDPAFGGYAPDKYVSNFAGYLPANDPRLVIVVVIDEPQKGMHFGGIAAAPVFRKIATGTLQMMGLLPSGAVAEAPQARAQGAGAEEEVDTAPEALAYEDGESADEGDAEDVSPLVPASSVPDFRGLSLREAFDLLKKSKLTLDPEVRGSGRVVAQDPPPGSKLKANGKLRLTLQTARGERHASR